VKKKNKSRIVMALLGLVLVAWGLFYFLQDKPRHFFKRKAKVAESGIDTADANRKAMFYSLDTFFENKSISQGFSGSVLIALKGKPVYEKCFGYCDYRTKNRMEDTAAFQLASVTKTLTATAALWCIEQNMFGLEDTLQKFFPKFPYRGIRVKDLLCHRSGLSNYIYFLSGKCKSDEYFTNREVIEYMIAQKPPLNAKPDVRFEYCNTNYMLLAAIIEQVSGQAFKAFMHDNFFEPLGMKHTFIYDHENALDRKIAQSYNSKWEIQDDDCFDGVTGDKGCYSTAADLFTWDRAFYEGKLLSQEMMKEAYSPRSFEKPGKRNYGYGWRLAQQPDSTYLVYHNGWWHGNNTVFYRHIQDSSCVIILSNKYARSVYDVNPVWGILYPKNSLDSNED
jgi:CubicO group peptidase (beta-lactamase class C family)